MTASQTNHERHEAQKQKRAAARHDRERAIDICRAIRDRENASDFARLEAIKLLSTLTEE